MDDPNTEPIPKRARPLHVAVPTIIPLFVAFYSIQGTMLFDEHHGFNAVARLLVGWCAALLASGTWLNHDLFRRVKIRLPFVATVVAVVAILPIWLWQGLAYKSQQISSSSDGPWIWIFSHARRGACSPMDSHLSFLGGRCLPYSLLHGSLDLESGPSPFVAVPDSVVALCDGYLLSAFHVSRCSGKRLRCHLATANRTNT
jgi:hypothetical protein